MINQLNFDDMHKFIIDMSLQGHLPYKSHEKLNISDEINS